MIEADVYLGNDLVGLIAWAGETPNFAFHYEREWLARRDAFPLSPALPFPAPGEKPSEVDFARANHFFGNLLPEGEALDDVARLFQLSKGNVLGLLLSVGRETAGAIRIVRIGGNREPEAETRRVITPEELSERIRNRDQIPFTVWDRKVRLSIAGYQDKLAVMEDAGQWFLVEGPRLASSHILKPEPRNGALSGLVSNEFFCMRLARAAGLPTARVSLAQVPERVLVVERFDRQVSADGVARVHVIDGCQLLGIRSHDKYERNLGDALPEIREGASLPKFFATLNQDGQPLVQRRAMLRWTLFQVLIGNFDAHAKNLSFFVDRNGVRMAEAYDLVCGQAMHESHLANTFAMAIGDAFTLEEVDPFEWALFCAQTEMPHQQVSKELGRLADVVKRALGDVARRVISEGADPQVVERVAASVADQCERQRAIASKIAGMMPLALESLEQNAVPTAAPRMRS